MHFPRAILKTKVSPCLHHLVFMEGSQVSRNDLMMPDGQAKAVFCLCPNVTVEAQVS
jgi:hypothetical protein